MTKEKLWKAVVIAAIKAGRDAYDAAKAADYVVGYYVGSKHKGIFEEDK